MAILYWVKWKSCIFKLASDSPNQGFDEMEDMFRYSGDMPRRVFYKPPPTEADKPFGMFYVEMISTNNRSWLDKQVFPRWNSFGAWTKFVDYINTPLEMQDQTVKTGINGRISQRKVEGYRYNSIDTKNLFNTLLAKKDMGMYADW